MRTTQLVTSYLSSGLFTALGVRAYLGWRRDRDARAAHLALATITYGVSQLISAMSTTIWDSSVNQHAPRVLSVAQSTLSYVGIFFFLLFLFDFVKVPAFVPWVVGVLTLTLIVLSALEHTVIKINPTTKVIEGLSGSPIEIKTFINGIILYYLIAFGILWISFIVFGLRVKGLARFRMASIGLGFFLLFVVFGLIPRLIKVGAQLKGPLVTTIIYVAVAAAPLFFIGFTPPKFITRRFNGHTPD